MQSTPIVICFDIVLLTAAAAAAHPVTEIHKETHLQFLISVYSFLTPQLLIQFKHSLQTYFNNQKKLLVAPWYSFTQESVGASHPSEQQQQLLQQQHLLAGPQCKTCCDTRYLTVAKAVARHPISMGSGPEVRAILEGQRCSATMRRLQLWSCGLTHWDKASPPGVQSAEGPVLKQIRCV